MYITSSMLSTQCCVVIIQFSRIFFKQGHIYRKQVLPACTAQTPAYHVFIYSWQTTLLGATSNYTCTCTLAKHKLATYY